MASQSTVRFCLSSLAPLLLAACGGENGQGEASAGPSEAADATSFITLAPASEPSVLRQTLIVRRFPLPEGFFEGGSAEEASAKVLLERDGAGFAREMRARFDRSEGILEVKTTEKEMSVVEAVVDFWGLAERSARQKQAAAVSRKLREIVIPEVAFEAALLSEALATLERESALHDDTAAEEAERGVRIVVDRSQSRGGGASQPPEVWPGGAEDPKVTLRLRHVALYDALRFTVREAERRWDIVGPEVRVGFHGYFDSELVSEAFPVPPDIPRMVAERSSWDRSDDPFARPGDRVAPFVPTVRTWIESFGVIFPGAATADYDPQRGILIVRNHPDQLSLVVHLLGLVGEQSKAEAWREARREGYERKLDEIVLHGLSFEEESLFVAAESLWVGSRLADRGGPVWERGVPVWVDHISPEPFADPWPAQYRLTSVDLSKLTVREALERICAETGAGFRVEPTGVRIFKQP